MIAPALMEWSREVVPVPDDDFFVLAGGGDLEAIRRVRDSAAFLEEALDLALLIAGGVVEVDQLVSATNSDLLTIDGDGDRGRNVLKLDRLDVITNDQEVLLAVCEDSVATSNKWAGALLADSHRLDDAGVILVQDRERTILAGDSDIAIGKRADAASSRKATALFAEHSIRDLAVLPEQDSAAGIRRGESTLNRGSRNNARGVTALSLDGAVVKQEVEVTVEANAHLLLRSPQDASLLLVHLGTDFPGLRNLTRLDGDRENLAVHLCDQDLLRVRSEAARSDAGRHLVGLLELASLTIIDADAPVEADGHEHRAVRSKPRARDELVVVVGSVVELERRALVVHVLAVVAGSDHPERPLGAQRNSPHRSSVALDFAEARASGGVQSAAVALRALTDNGDTLRILGPRHVADWAGDRASLDLERLVLVLRGPDAEVAVFVGGRDPAARRRVRRTGRLALVLVVDLAIEDVVDAALVDERVNAVAQAVDLLVEPGEEAKRARWRRVGRVDLVEGDRHTGVTVWNFLNQFERDAQGDLSARCSADTGGRNGG